MCMALGLDSYKLCYKLFYKGVSVMTIVEQDEGHGTADAIA